jgi:hypothetical protein
MKIDYLPIMGVLEKGIPKKCGAKFMNTSFQQANFFEPTRLDMAFIEHIEWIGTR